MTAIASVDPAKLDKIVAAVKDGATLAAAARSVKLRPKTVQDWVRTGMSDDPDRQAQDELVVQFAERVRQAQGTIEADAANVIVRAAKDGDWRAALAFLERRFPERWRLQQTTEHTGPGGGPVTVTFEELVRSAAAAPTAASEEPA